MALKPFEVEKLSFGNSIVLEGTDSPETIFSDVNIPVGSVYIKYGGNGSKSIYQKTGTGVGQYNQMFSKNFIIAMATAL